MPMQLTISRNRKQSENYNSQGYGVSLTVELDQSLLTRPDDLQHAIDELYQEADAALERQASGSDNGSTQQQREPATNGRGHDRNARVHTSQKRNAANNNTSGGMTQSQRRAIRAICQRLDIDPREEARHEFGLDIEQMSVREASAMIDHLKSLQSSRQNGG